MIISKGEYIIRTGSKKLDIDYIHSVLAGSYWAKDIPKETIAKSIHGSLCFGVFHLEKQVGFARMVTDQATFAYLADVFIDEKYRGKGLSKWMMEFIMAHPGMQGLRRIMLATRDAHDLYAKFGFTRLTHTERWMHIHDPDVYKKQK